MSKKTIVLADNSYTIRRIVELSFSEEQDIELITFETSLNLREKLLELRPHVVLVDIKLPEFNGYNVCRYVQENESLKHTRVFLLKGGFEPIDEAQLSGLNYVDIITKPFDSNALVGNIKRLLEEMPAVQTTGKTRPEKAYPEVMPTSLPEPDDLPEIDTMPGADADISFSDVKEEIETDGLLADDFSPSASVLPDDEILPSEEITQAQGDRDLLNSQAAAEDFYNPFRDDSPESESVTEEELNIKRNIEIQEKELEIGSLTLEELNIKQQLERQRARRQPLVEEFHEPEEPTDSDTSELFPGQVLDENDSPIASSGMDKMYGDADEIVDEMPDEIVDDMPDGISDEDALFSLDGRRTEPPGFGTAEEKLFSDELDMPRVEYQPHDGTDLHQDAVTFEEEDSWAMPGSDDLQEEFSGTLPRVEETVYPRKPAPAASVPRVEEAVYPRKPAPAASVPRVEETVYPRKPAPAASVEANIMDMFSDRGMDQGWKETPATPQRKDVKPPRFDEDVFPPEAPTPQSEDIFGGVYEPPETDETYFPETPDVETLEEPSAPEISDDVFAGVYEKAQAEDIPETETPTAQSFKGIPDQFAGDLIEQEEPLTLEEEEENLFAGYREPSKYRLPPDFETPAKFKEPVSEPSPRATVIPTKPTPAKDIPKANLYANVYVSREPAAVIKEKPVDKFTDIETGTEARFTWDKEEPVAAKPIPEPPTPPIIPEEEPVVKESPTAPKAQAISIPHEDVLRKIEDKLTHAIKEMLWEIVPPLAEKIIKDEIEALKKEAEKAFK